MGLLVWTMYKIYFSWMLLEFHFHLKCMRLLFSVHPYKRLHYYFKYRKAEKDKEKIFIVFQYMCLYPLFHSGFTHIHPQANNNNNKNNSRQNRNKWTWLWPQSGEGNGTPLQYSCLENPTDGGAWWAAVHGITKSWTWLSDFTFTFHLHTLEKEMATHSSVLAWRIPGTGEPGGLSSMGSHRVGHDWSDLAA